MSCDVIFNNRKEALPGNTEFVHHGLLFAHEIKYLQLKTRLPFSSRSTYNSIVQSGVEHRSMVVSVTDTDVNVAGGCELAIGGKDGDVVKVSAFTVQRSLQIDKQTRQETEFANEKHAAGEILPLWKWVAGHVELHFCTSSIICWPTCTTEIQMMALFRGRWGSAPRTRETHTKMVSFKKIPEQAVAMRKWKPKGSTESSKLETHQVRGCGDSPSNHRLSGSFNPITHTYQCADNTSVGIDGKDSVGTWQPVGNIGIGSNVSISSHDGCHKGTWTDTDTQTRWHRSMTAWKCGQRECTSANYESSTCKQFINMLESFDRYTFSWTLPAGLFSMTVAL